MTVVVALLGLVLLVLGVVGAIGCGFQMWRLLGGPVSGKRLRELDIASAPLGLRAGGRICGLVACGGAVLVVVGLLR